MTVPQEIGAYYATGAEGDRLKLGYFQLERRRTEQLLNAHLPSSPAKVFDVGGATGPYARMLTARGHEVISSTRSPSTSKPPAGPTRRESLSRVP